MTDHENHSMREPNRLTDAQLAKISRHRTGVRTSFACERLHLSQETEKLFEKFDRQHLSMTEREARLIALSRERRQAKARIAR